MGVLIEDFQIAFVNNVSVSDVLEIGTFIAYLVCNTVSGYQPSLHKTRSPLKTEKKKSILQNYVLFVRVMVFVLNIGESLD